MTTSSLERHMTNVNPRLSADAVCSQNYTLAVCCNLLTAAWSQCLRGFMSLAVIVSVVLLNDNAPLRYANSSLPSLPASAVAPLHA